jgi:hypothetical protein
MTEILCLKANVIQGLSDHLAMTDNIHVIVLAVYIKIIHIQDEDVEQAKFKVLWLQAKASGTRRTTEFPLTFRHHASYI